MTLFCIKITLVKAKEVKPGWSTNLVESSKEGYGSKGAVLQMMTTIKEFIQTAYNLCHNNKVWLRSNAKPFVQRI
jgi:hypothetical protein